MPCGGEFSPTKFRSHTIARIDPTKPAQCWPDTMPSTCFHDEVAPLMRLSPHARRHLSRRHGSHSDARSPTARAFARTSWKSCPVAVVICQDGPHKARGACKPKRIRSTPRRARLSHSRRSSSPSRRRLRSTCAAPAPSQTNCTTRAATTARSARASTSACSSWTRHKRRQSCAQACAQAPARRIHDPCFRRLQGATCCWGAGGVAALSDAKMSQGDRACVASPRRQCQRQTRSLGPVTRDAGGPRRKRPRHRHHTTAVAAASPAALRPLGGTAPCGACGHQHQRAILWTHVQRAQGQDLSRKRAAGRKAGRGATAREARARGRRGSGDGAAPMRRPNVLGPGVRHGGAAAPTR